MYLKQLLRRWLIVEEKCSCGATKPQGYEKCGPCFVSTITATVEQAITEVLQPQQTPAAVPAIPVTWNVPTPEIAQEMPGTLNYAPLNYELSYSGMSQGVVITDGNGNIVLSNEVVLQPTDPPLPEFIETPENRNIKL